MAVRTPIILAVHKDAPFKDFAEMVAYAKKNPGNVRVGTVGPGSVGHFTVEIISSLTGADQDVEDDKLTALALELFRDGSVNGERVRKCAPAVQASPAPPSA